MRIIVLTARKHNNTNIQRTEMSPNLIITEKFTLQIRALLPQRYLKRPSFTRTLVREEDNTIVQSKLWTQKLGHPPNFFYLSQPSWVQANVHNLFLL